jgi:hypothetical protein
MRTVVVVVLLLRVCLWAVWQRGQHRPQRSSSSGGTWLGSSSSSSLLLNSNSKVLLQLAAARLAGPMLLRRGRAGVQCIGPAAVAAGVLAVAAAELCSLQGVVAGVVAHFLLLLVVAC